MPEPALARAPSVAGDDASLAAAAAAGDRRALETLLERYADRVHAICRRIVVHPEDALDATQEALIAITRGIGRFDGRSAFTTWLYRVATNAALDELRRRSRRPVPWDAPLDLRARAARAQSTRDSTSIGRWPRFPKSSGPRWCSATSPISSTRRSRRCSGFPSAR